MGSPSSDSSAPCFHARLSPFQSNRPSTSKRSEVSSRARSLLLGVPLRSRRASCLSTRSSPTRVSALFATSSFRVHSMQAHPKHPLRSVLRLSQPLDGLLRETSHRLISSRSHVRVPSRSGASPLVQPFLPHQEKLPPCRFTCPSSLAETSCQSNTPRLRGFAPHEVTLFTVWFYPFRDSLPSSGSRFLRAFLLRLALRFTRLAPLMTLPNVIFACALVSSDRLQRFSTAILTSRHLCPGQPARNFRAFLTLRFG